MKISDNLKKQTVVNSDSISVNNKTQTKEDDLNSKENLLNKDSFVISENAMKMYAEQILSSDGQSDYMEDWAKIIEIANRIAKGDVVPASDEKKLLEADPDLYLSAKSAAVLNSDKKHKKHKALFEDDKNSQIKEQINALKTEEHFSDYSASDVEQEHITDD